RRAWREVLVRRRLVRRFLERRLLGRRLPSRLGGPAPGARPGRVGAAVGGGGGGACGWPGWGWGWGGGGTWGWSVSAPIVVAPPVGTSWSAYGEPFYVEQQSSAPAVTTPPPPPEHWWHWCASARGYYPYVQSCAEGWQRVAPQIPPQ